MSIQEKVDNIQNLTKSDPFMQLLNWIYSMIFKYNFNYISFNIKENMQNRVVNPYHLALIGGRNREVKRGKGGKEKKIGDRIGEILYFSRVSTTFEKGSIEIKVDNHVA